MDIFSKLSNISRIKRLELFHMLFSPGKQTRILDIGAEINPNGNRGVQLIDSFPWKNNITAVNLSKRHIDLINRYYPQVEAVVADACKLPWPDNYFDIVYSNAVIEHVGHGVELCRASSGQGFACRAGPAASASDRITTGCASISSG